ncbi:MAG TPA: NAD kinase [Microbacteriaceae bacterium]|nr:NAD kinase [Microbacteriaceae bacterium]
MSTILVMAHVARPDSLDATRRAVARLSQAGARAVISAEQWDDIVAHAPQIASQALRLGVDVSASELTLVLALGGDGTILRAAELVRDAGTPILGVNLGSVGFLAEVELDSLDDTVDRALAGTYRIEDRLALDVRVTEGDREVYLGWALNEVTVEKAAPARMLDVVLEVDGRPISSIGCDGVVFATPTGSTAYNFSAGGPIVWPGVEALLCVPLSAHALFAKPLVVAPDSTLSVEIRQRSAAEGTLICDGRRVFSLNRRARVSATRSDQPVRLARVHDDTFADRLVRKFDLPVSGWRGPEGGS